MPGMMQDGEGLLYRRIFFFKKKEINKTPSTKRLQLEFFLACKILLTILSFTVLLSGNRSMALIILASAFHLSAKFLARLYIDVVLFGDLNQSIDARISALQMFLQMLAGSQVLITGPVKLDACLTQQFLNVKTVTASTFFASKGSCQLESES